MAETESIIIYTDGGCSGNPGPGGWAFVMRDGSGSITEASGGENPTTNNRMELKAVIEALGAAEARTAGGSVIVRTDSQYVRNGISSWIHAWKRNGWRTADKKPVKNQELWMALDAVATRLHCQFEWVKGHAGIEENERCDDLVQVEIAQFRG
jgi:ribonuclease HI